MSAMTASPCYQRRLFTSDMATLLQALLILFVMFGSPAHATDAVLDQGSQLLALNQGQLSMLRDPAGSMSIADVAQLKAANRFTPLAGNLALGYTPDTIWLTATLVRKADVEPDWRLEIEPSYLDDVRLYIQHGDSFDRQSAGDLLPLSQRANHNTALFRLNLPEGETRIFLRVKTSSTMAVIPRLWTPAALDAARQQSLTLHGAYFGLMLAVILFNLVNGLITRRRICYLYSAYAFSSAFIWWAINGFLGQFWLPEFPALANLLLPLSICVNTLLATVFYYIVLDIRNYPRVRRFYQGFVLLSLATMIGTLFGRYQLFAPWLFIGVLLWIPATISPAWFAWKSGRADARFTAVAYSSFAVLASINMLTLLGLIDASMWSLVWAGQASNLAHILLLHVSIIFGLRRVDEDAKATDIRIAEARRDTQRQQADSAETSRFLSMITHEIRTPISVIAAASESLRILDTDNSPQRIDRYDKINRAVQRMVQLVEILLTRNTADLDQLSTSSLQLAPVDLISLTQEVIAQHPDGRQRLQLKALSLLPLAMADSRHLRFVLINLIDNALKYSTPATPIDIRITPHEEEGLPMEVEWRISNQGERIPASERERIFDKHARLSETAGKPGLGLGLYLARHIVHQHGGRLFVDPQTVTGASFVLWLPTVKPAGA